MRIFERIAGTDSRRQDFDESRLAEEYDPSFEADEKLGAFEVWKLKLNTKAGVDVDKETGRKVARLMEALDDHDYVQNVYSNANLTEAMMAG